MLSRRALAAALALASALVLAPLPAVAAPPANVPPVPNFDSTCLTQAGRVLSGYCTLDPATGTVRWATPAREGAAMAAIDAARASEGLPPLALPANMASLTADQQQFVLINLERVARGLAPMAALVPSLGTLALQGAETGTDPQLTGVWTGYAGGSNWAADAQPAAAMYRFMYEDGWGGSAANTPNIDCGGPGAPGCWGHRHNVLMHCSPVCLAGVGTVPPSGGGLGASAQVFVSYDGLPVPVSYTWTEAVAAGAAGGGLGPADPGPLWPFADLAQAPWAAGAAALLSAEGVLRGTAPGVLDAGAPLQVQALVTLLARVLGWAPQPPLAPAGTAAWATGAVGAAAARGLLPADSPVASATRLQAAALVVGALGLPAAAAPMPYSDLGGLSAQSLGVLSTAVADRLLIGDGQGRLDPGGNLTRAQAVLLLQRAILTLARQGVAPTLPLPLAAATLGSGAVLYSAGGLRLLAPAATADPVEYWESGGPAEPTLLAAAGSWWSGVSTWTAEAAPAWAPSASLYGRAETALWPAGATGVGTALFDPTVRVVAFGASTQVLIPGSNAWAAASPAVATDPALALAQAVLS